ncbi:MFS transporter [Paenibacillus gorillae]|uniref:MFS transporter n=1 Tax=Paenibacillus gorillae TaxID=1243662 RepID=UPI0004B6E531|nr:MFS transporter [Paenibacillus gorillae]
MQNRSHKIILFITCITVFMASLDVFIVNVALNNIGQSIGESSLSNLSWVLNGYAIFYASLLVPAGKLADRYGQKRGFIWGIALFTASSLGAALSGNLWLLVMFRCLQAAGGAMLTPSGLGLLLTNIPDEHKKRAVRIWASSGSLAAAAGPAVGGFLLELSWEWIFVVNIPIGILAILAALRYIPKDTPNQASRFPDLWGGILLIIAIGSLSLGLDKAPDWGWGNVYTWASFIVFAVTLLWFILQSRRHPFPIIEFSLFRSRPFTRSNVAALLINAAFALELLSVIMYLQSVWNWSTLTTGLALTIGPCLVWPSAILAQRLSKYIQINKLAALGNLLIGVGPLLFILSVQITPNYWLQVLPGWLVIGIGYGFALPIMMSSATSELPRQQASTGSAVVNMSRQIGSVLGTTLLVIALSTSSAPSLENFHIGWWIAVVLSLLGAVAALGILPKAVVSSMKPVQE